MKLPGNEMFWIREGQHRNICESAAFENSRDERLRDMAIGWHLPGLGRERTSWTGNPRYRIRENDSGMKRSMKRELRNWKIIQTEGELTGEARKMTALAPVIRVKLYFLQDSHQQDESKGIGGKKGVQDTQ